MKKKFAVLLLSVLFFAGGARSGAVNAAVPFKEIHSDTLEGMAVTLMQPGIMSAVNTFYGQYLNRLTLISVPGTKITDILSYNGGVFFDVTVETKPLIAADTPVGQDRISLYVNSNGIVTAEKFEHQKNIALPESYKGRILKPLPDKTVIDLPKRTHVYYDIEATPDNKMTTAQKLDALVRVLVISDVQNAVNVFYAPYLSTPQMNAYFGYEIVQVIPKTKEYGYGLVVTITPYAGAHNSIGKEKITMGIWIDGSVTVTDYEHLRNYGIVPWLADSLKKPLPKGTQDK